MRNTVLGLVGLVLTSSHAAELEPSPADLTAQVGQPVNIAPSAYVYRADRTPAENAPESWFALMRYASQPLNQRADANDPAIQRALCALLWEEIRPIQRVELSWTANEQRRPRVRRRRHQ